MAVLIVIGIILVIVIWVVSLYNGLVKLRNRRQNAFADIDVQLRQRHDLVEVEVATRREVLLGEGQLEHRRRSRGVGGALRRATVEAVLEGADSIEPAAVGALGRGGRALAG